MKILWYCVGLIVGTALGIGIIWVASKIEDWAFAKFDFDAACVSVPSAVLLFCVVLCILFWVMP